MKVRNNTNRDFSLQFTDGTAIHLSRGEISKDIPEEKVADPFFAKAIKARKVIPVREPVEVPKPIAKPAFPKDEIMEEKPKARSKKARKAVPEGGS